MRPLVIAAAAVPVFCLALGGGYVLRRSLTDATADREPVATPVPPTADLEPARPDVVDADAPPRLRGFRAWEPGRRLSVVTGLQEDPRLPAAELAFLREAITDDSLQPVTRNNMANCLVGQAEPDPELYRLFARMYADPDGDPVWRDYCLQFLGCCLPDAADPAAVRGILLEAAAEGPGSSPGTAMIHLVRNAEAGHIALPDGFWADLVARLDDPATPAGVRFTIAGLFGRSGDPAHLPRLRRLLTATDSDELRRAVIGSLGLLGGPAELELIEPYTAHADPGVALAATAACARLRRAAADATAGEEP